MSPELGRGNVPRAGNTTRSRNADKDLGLLALITSSKDRFPGAVVEAVEGSIAWDEIADRIVVELDEERVELGVLDQIRVAVGRKRALRGSCDDDAAALGAELFHHGDIRSVICFPG